jgi:hypothetical protein
MAMWSVVEHWMVGLLEAWHKVEEKDFICKIMFVKEII